MQNKTASQMATVYGLKSSIAFNKILEKCGLLVHTNDGYILADSLRGQGYVAVISVPFFLPSGVRIPKKRSAWTEKGQQFIRQRLAHIGIYPANEQTDLFTSSN